MTDELDLAEGRLARQLADFAETPFPARDSVDQVIARTAAAGHARASRNRLAAVFAAAAVVVLAVGGIAGLGLGVPAATPQPTATPAATSAGIGLLHLTAETNSDLPHDGLEVRYLLADGAIFAESDTVPAETTVFVDRALPAGPVRILANGRECSGTLLVEPDREIDVVFSGLYDEVCKVSVSGSHVPGVVVHPEPRTALGAFVVVDSFLVVRPLDPGNAIGVIRKPADELAEVPDFDIPPGRYALDLEVRGTVLNTLEIDLKRGQEFWFNVRALAPEVPRDCGEVPAADCEAALAAVYLHAYGAGSAATRHVLSVRVRPSKYQLACITNADRRYDVTFQVREEPYALEATVDHRPGGGMEYCTY